jgi:ferredoxin
MCTQVAPTAFTLNEAGQSVFHPGASWTDDVLGEAADACPMSAIKIFEAVAKN